MFKKITKEEMSQIKNLSIHFKELEKKRKINQKQAEERKQCSQSRNK